jgi:hypothetical protein
MSIKFLHTSAIKNKEYNTSNLILINEKLYVYKQYIIVYQCIIFLQKLHWFEDTHAKAVTDNASVIIQKFQ